MAADRDRKKLNKERGAKKEGIKSPEETKHSATKPPKLKQADEAGLTTEGYTEAEQARQDAKAAHRARKKARREKARLRKGRVAKETANTELNLNASEKLKTSSSASSAPKPSRQPDYTWLKRRELPPVQLFSSGVARSPAPSPEPSPVKVTTPSTRIIPSPKVTTPGKSKINNEKRSSAVNPIPETKHENIGTNAGYSTTVKHSNSVHSGGDTVTSHAPILPDTAQARNIAPRAILPPQSGLKSTSPEKNCLPAPLLPPATTGKTPERAIEEPNKRALKRSLPPSSTNEVQPVSSNKRRRKVEPNRSPISTSTSLKQTPEATRPKGWKTFDGKLRGYIVKTTAEDDDSSVVEENIAISSSYLEKRGRPVLVGNVNFSIIRVTEGETIDLLKQRKKAYEIVIFSVAKGKVKVEIGDVDFVLGENGAWRSRFGETCKVTNLTDEEAVLHVSGLR